MKKILILTLLSLFLLCTMACEKDDPQNQQLVIDSITKEPIANAKVELTIDESTDIFSSSRRLLETVYTDAEGRYEFESSINTSDGYHEIFVFADRYFDITSGQGYSQNKLVELVPEGYLKIRVQKLDTVEFVSCKILGGGRYEFSGYKIDTILEDVQRAGNRGRLNLFLNRSGQNELYVNEDSLYIPRHDTIYYEITF